MTTLRRRAVGVAALATAALASLTPSPAIAQAREITLWSHWAAEQPKRQFVEEAIRRFEAANPGVTVRATWYEKNALYAALRNALRAGQGPDVFYAEPDQVEYVQNNFLLDLSDGINWANVENPPVPAFNYFEFRRVRLIADGVGYGVYDFRLQVETEPEAEDTVTTPVTTA